MKIRSILALLDGGAGTESAARAAISVGQAFNAHVEFLRIESTLPAAVTMADGIAGSAALSASWHQPSTERTAHAKAIFDELCAGAELDIVEPDGPVKENGATFSWRMIFGHENPEVAYRGRTVDLIVMARADEDNGGVDSATLEAALFDSGKPVLIVGGDSPLHCNGRLAIAWDGSREAAHSVGLAIPLLESARSVTVLTVERQNDSVNFQPLRQYMRRHAIECEPIAVNRRNRGIAEALQDEISERDLDLMIMGAYGHNAIGEFIFGGVTRDMLQASQVPLFLAH